MARRGGRRNRPHLFILRGLPGSGKTQLASEIMDQYDLGNGEILSTDEYYINANGRYVYRHRLRNIAHQWNRDRAQEAMANGAHPIIIDNTNMRRCEMKPYVKMGLDYGYYIRFRTTPNTWAWSVEELYEWIHGVVPKWVMYRMKKNYEPVRNIYDVLNDSTHFYE
ncbi:hypothetical protein AAFF_G00128100 [Aldrovandia affinis]|uniref:NEDD4-binding protein 2-like 1 n=1 Tax=Aldrovandia affinis TaxID=143900 RepID=A0AAD7T152_9TELE|nr:hypothetical protein AAFF_G00128100 [Aldrovandia affinis]